MLDLQVGSLGLHLDCDVTHVQSGVRALIGPLAERDPFEGGLVGEPMHEGEVDLGLPAIRENPPPAFRGGAVEDVAPPRTSDHRPTTRTAAAVPPTSA